MTKDEVLMRDVLNTLRGARIFVTSRERIKHPEGTAWYDSAITDLEIRLLEASP